MKSKNIFRFFVSIIVILLFMVVGAASPPAEAGEKGNKNLNFKWAVLRLDTNNKYEIISNQKRPQLSSEDLIKIFIQPITNAYVYVYLLDSRNELKLLFPTGIDYFDSDYEFGKNYYIPIGENFFAIDEHKGTEKLYLLASAERLKELESLTGEYLNASGNKKITAKSEILKEIKRLKTHFSMSSSSSERPIPIAGSFSIQRLRERHWQSQCYPGRRDKLL